MAREMGPPDFRGLVRVNTTPSGCFFNCLISSSQRTDDRSGDTKARNIKSFFVRNLRFSPSDER